MSLSRIAVVSALALWLVGCATTEGEPASVPSERLAGGEECPVTVLDNGFEPSPPEAAVYTENFPEPNPYPVDYPSDDSVWYGSGGLWTVLPLNDLYDERKTVFWSANFPGGTVEERPDLHVMWTRLDTDEETVFDNEGVATNGYTPDVGWFMITGLEERLGAGCWQVEAAYKGATLSYAYEKD